MFDKAEDILETKLHNRMKFLSSDKGDYEDYKSSLISEECDTNKKRREELFLNRRKYNNLYSSSNMDISNSEFSHPIIKGKTGPIDNNPFNDIPQITAGEIDQIKKILSEPISSEENYLKLLDYIITRAQDEININILMANDILSLLSKRFYALEPKISNLAVKSIYAISTLCRSNAQKEFYMVKLAMTKSCNILKLCYSELEEHLVKLLLWLISYACEKFTKKAVRILFSEDMIPLLFAILKEKEDILKYSLRILGNVCFCSNKTTQKVIDEGLLKELSILLSHHEVSIRKDAVWIVSNIAVGSPNQLESLIEENLYLQLKEIVRRDFTVVRKEAMWAICNLTNVTNPNYAGVLIDQGILDDIMDFIQQPNPKFIAVALEAILNLLQLENIFFKYPDSNEMTNSLNIKKSLAEKGFLEILEKLHYHQNKLVSQKAMNIIEDHMLSKSDF